MKGIFKKAPSLPRYCVTWDPARVLSYMDSLPRNSELLLENLTKKLCTLLAILSGSRCQTIVSLDLDHCHLNENQTQLSFYISKVLKNTKPGHHQAPLEFLGFPGNEKWCPIHCFLEYTKRTRLIRENSNPGVMKGLLILRHSHPFTPVTAASTIGRYVKSFLQEMQAWTLTPSPRTRHDTRQRAQL